MGLYDLTLMGLCGLGPKWVYMTINFKTFYFCLS
jgi:hypothetical protein